MRALKYSGAALVILLTGCSSSDFNYGKVRGIIEGSPLRLDAEYVMLSQREYMCGIQEDLWDTPTTPIGLAGQTGVARLTQKGRDLKFSDDVSIGDMRYPYVQVRGDLSISVTEITSDRDGPEQFTKLVETKMGVNIPNTCFPNPLPIMGVRKGKFTQDYSPVLFFRYNNGWSIDRVFHN